MTQAQPASGHYLLLCHRAIGRRRRRVALWFPRWRQSDGMKLKSRVEMLGLRDLLIQHRERLSDFESTHCVSLFNFTLDGWSASTTIHHRLRPPENRIFFFVNNSRVFFVFLPSNNVFWLKISPKLIFMRRRWRKSLIRLMFSPLPIHPVLVSEPDGKMFFR